MPLDPTTILQLLKDYQGVIGAFLAFIFGYVLSKIQNNVTRRSKISRELYQPLHSEVVSMRLSLIRGYAVETVAYGVTGWNKFRQLGVASSIERKLHSTLEKFYDDVAMYNLRLRDATESSMKIMNSYVEEDFVAKPETNLGRALGYVPQSIWSTFLPDLLGEPLPSGADPIGQKRAILDLIMSSRGYGVVLTDAFLGDIRGQLEGSTEFMKFQQVRKALIQESLEITKALENRIRKYGI